MIKQHASDIAQVPSTDLNDFAPNTAAGWVVTDPAGFPASPLYVDTSAAAATAVVVKPQPMALYLTEPGGTTPISVDDIHQGQIGDCFLLSSIGELALWHSASITGMIHGAATTSSSGSETVTLYAGANGQPAGFGATVFKTITETVTNSFATNGVNNGAARDVVNGTKEIWVQVLEKAVAQEDGGMSAISNGGNPCIALQELTGHTATWNNPATLSAATLTKDLLGGDLIVMDTASSGTGYGLVGGHAYMMEGVQGSGTSAMVKLGNPWGMDQPQLIPVANLAKAGIVEVDIGHW